MRLSLGVVLALCLAGLQFIAALIVVMSTYFSSERALLDHARDLLSDVATNTIEHSKGFLTPARGAAELATRLAENQIVASDNPALLEKLLFQQLQTAPQFAGVFYGDEDGNFTYVMKSEGPGPFRSKFIARDGEARNTQLIWRDDRFRAVKTQADPADTYDPRVRPWYKNAKASSKLIWTDPYIFFSAKKPGITVASPVLDPQGSVTGVIGVDIEIDAISDFLGGLKVGKSGKALILNQNGDVIAHPDPKLIIAENADGTLRFLSIDQINDPIARTAFGSLNVDGNINVESEISSTFTHDGGSYVSTLKPIESDALPWTVAVYAPENDFIGGIKDNRATNIGITAGVAGIAALIGLMIARRIHSPIRALALRATRISQGQYSDETPFPRTFSELERANETMMREIARRKTSEAEYGRTFDLASRGMAQISPQNGMFLRVNQKLSDITGYSANELLNMSMLDLYHPDERAGIKSIELALHGSQSEYLREKRCIREDGREIWVKINAIPIHDENGSQLHTVVTLDDITEVKEADAQITKLNNDLTHNARMNTMGEMAAGIAHEINQPLTAITQNTDTALLTAAETESTDPELVELLKDIDNQAHRAADIIRSLRGFVRKDDPVKTQIDLNQLMRQSVRLVQAEAKENNVEIIVRDTDVPDIRGMRVQIAQVLVNLLRNAIDAIAEAGEASERRIWVWASIGENGRVDLCVEDTGLGIDPNIELFTQFETTKKDGMGLGLTISKGIMEAHGGDLRHSKTSKGHARFCCSFPKEAKL